MYIWQKSAAAFLAIGAASAAALYAAKNDTDAAYIFTLALLVVWSAWTGALFGCVLDWARYRRSPLEPLFKGRFGWFYGRSLWFRFGVAFAAAWAGFVALSVAVALIVGDTNEARPFFTFKGGIVLALFLVVFAALGAVIGGILDFVRYLHGNGRKEGPTSGLRP